MLALYIAVAVVGGYVIGAVSAVQISICSKSGKKELKRKFPFSVTNIAHRGGSLLGPENTVYTFTRAVKEGGCDMIELDVRESKDGKIVVFHDQILERVCGSKYAGVAVSDIIVGENPSESLPQCQRVIPLEFKTSDVTQYEATSNVPQDDTTRLCLLTEVFDQFPSLPFHIDIKDEGKDFVTSVLNLISSHNRESITFVGSSHQKNRQYMGEYFKECGQEARERFRLFAGPRDFLLTYVLFYMGLLPCTKLNFDVFSIPVFIGAMKATAASEFGTIIAEVAAFLFTSPLLWKYLESRGVAVVGWNFNDEADMIKSIGFPLNGVMTDDPITVSRVLRAHENDKHLVELRS